tara:strand:- start:407 stop:634 length:228 start_codon:yes stop_codon:yes gene_type:complete
MKIFLFIILCSGVAGKCLNPYKSNTTYDNFYDCMISGYEESLSRMEVLGPEAINEHKMFFKFFCTPEKEEKKLGT